MENEFLNKIKLCTMEDAEAAGAFYDRVVRHLDTHINYPKWEYRVYPSEASVRQMIAAKSQYVYLLDGKIAGAFVLNTDPQGAYENAAWSRDLAEGRYLVCHTLAVDPAFEGKHIGSRMVQFCVEYAKKYNFPAIRLDVVPENIPARKLYEKCGFVFAGDVDLERGMDEIPLFSMYELNLS